MKGFTCGFFVGIKLEIFIIVLKAHHVDQSLQFFLLTYYILGSPLWCLEARQDLEL